MNDQTKRGLLVAGLTINVLFLALALVDYALWDSQYMWPIFVGWAFLVLLIAFLALHLLRVRVHVERVAVPAAPVPAPAPAPANPAPVTFTPVKEPFPFVYKGYTLHSREVVLKNGGARQIWFFAKRRPASGKPAAKPAGYHVGVNERTGLP